MEWIDIKIWEMCRRRKIIGLERDGVYFSNCWDWKDLIGFFRGG